MALATTTATATAAGAIGCDGKTLRAMGEDLGLVERPQVAGAMKHVQPDTPVTPVTPVTSHSTRPIGSAEGSSAPATSASCEPSREPR